MHALFQRGNALVLVFASCASLQQQDDEQDHRLPNTFIFPMKSAAARKNGVNDTEVDTPGCRKRETETERKEKGKRKRKRKRKNRII